MTIEKSDSLPPDVLELARLRKENTKLQYQIKNYEALFARNKTVSVALTSMNAAMKKEKTKGQKYMSLLLDNCPDMILLLDSNLCFVHCTKVFLECIDVPSFGFITGRSYQEVFSRFAQPTWLEALRRVFEKAMEDQMPVTFEDVLDIANTGEPRHYTIQFRPMIDEADLAEGALLLFHDMTEILLAKEEAEKGSAAKGTFLSNMSHEIRTPLNAILGMTNIAQAAKADLAKKDYCLGKIKDASAHLLGVINDILDMSKIEANKFELNYSEFNIEKLLKDVVNVSNFRIEEKNQHFIVHIDNNLPSYVVSDEQHLAQVIVNLLSNAVKFTPENGKVKLSILLVEEQQGLCTIRVEIEDTGIGISDEQRQRLFKPFEQADASISRKFGGTGLGLTISKKIIEMMDGNIWVESTFGEGSNFIFTFKARRGASEYTLPILPVGTNWDTLRVLVIDDAPDVSILFKRFSEAIGFYCDGATSIAEADTLIKEASAPYDVFFINWRRPEAECIPWIQSMRSHIQPEGVVIMVSSMDLGIIETEARAFGINHFISKPLFSSVIVDCINMCLGLERTVSSETIEAHSGLFAGKHLLVVEDIEINREIVLALLESTGVIIDFAENGLVACELAERQLAMYDMIFMDIHMPELDGYEATRRIRALDVPEAKTIPIVAMTANVFREDIEECLSVGMDDHVGKPIDIDDLIAKLSKYLS